MVPNQKRCQSNVNIDEYDTCKHFKLLSSQEENQLTSRQLLFVQRQLQQEQKDSFPSFTADETETYASWQFCVVGRFVGWPGQGVSWPASHAVDLLALEWHDQSWPLKYINTLKSPNFTNILVETSFLKPKSYNKIQYFSRTPEWHLYFHLPTVLRRCHPKWRRLQGH